MSQSLREGTQRGNLNPPPSSPKPSAAPKSQGRNTSRNGEIELIKRQLSQLIHRIDGLKQQEA